MSTLEKVYGIHAVSSLLSHHGDSVEQLYVQAGRQDRRIQGLIDQAARFGVKAQQVTRQFLDEQCPGVHQGVLALGRPISGEKQEQDLFVLLDGLDHQPFLLVLDGVTDPHNLGACLRSAEAAGVDAVIVPKDKSVQLNPTVRKVACGAAEIVPFIAVTNLARTLQDLQQRGIWIFGAAGEADQSLYQADLKGS